MSQLRESTFSTEEEIKNSNIPDENETPNLTLKLLVQKALEFFMHFERIRFDLPWRWRKWSTIFSTALSYGGSKDSKINKRYEKVKEWELNEWRKKFGLDQITSNKYKKDKGKSKTIALSSTYNPYSQSNSSKNPEFDKAYWVEERKMHAFCISGDIKSLDILFNFLIKSQNDFKERILKLHEEYIKDIDVSAIKNLQKMKLPGNENDNTVFILLKQLAYWIRISDTLVSMDFNVLNKSQFNPADKSSLIKHRENVSTLFSKGNPKLLNEVGQFLLKLVTEEFDDSIMVNLDEYYRLIWVSIINGFELFYRSTESQFYVVKTLFSHSFKHKRLSTSLKRDKIVNHNYYLDCFNTWLSPIQLFFTIHFKYPQTFLFRVPLVWSEIKEYLVKFRLNSDPKSQSKQNQTIKPSNYDYVPSSSNKFIQKQTQFFNFITASDGMLDWKINEILDDYKALYKYNADDLIIDSAQEIQSCPTISQKDFCAPFSMFFLIDQSIHWVDAGDATPKNKNHSTNKKAEENAIDEEAEQSEDNIVDLYLQLFQNQSIDEILAFHGLQENTSDKQSKPTEKKHPKKAAKSEKMDEEFMKKLKEEADKNEKENQEKRRKILREVHKKECDLHKERTEFLWNEFTSVIIKLLWNSRDYGSIESSKLTPDIKEIVNSLNNIRYIWKIFNRMVEDALSIKQTWWINSEKNKPFLIKAIDFGEECITLLTNTPLSGNIYEIKWMRCLFKYLQIVISQSVNDLKQIDFASKTILSYMNIINMLSKLLGIKTDKETDMIKIADVQQNLKNESAIQGFYSG